MDKIYLKEMIFYAYHGAFAAEKELGQRFIMDLTLGLSLQAAGTTDDLTKTVHYGEVYGVVKQIMTEKSYDLIEAVAEKTAEEILKNFPLIREVTILLKKPEVPIAGVLSYAGIEITRKRGVSAYLGLGTNMGDKEEQIAAAIDMLHQEEGIKVKRQAHLYETAPVGYTDQDWFLNTVIEIETTLSPQALLQATAGIEQARNRVRSIHWGPRTLDVDILLYGDRSVHEENLQIPHLRLSERAFVLYPLVELVPDFVHPVLGKTMATLKKELADDQEIRVYEKR